MFEKIAEQLRNLTGKREPVDPARFADPLARRTEWTPLAEGGASFGTHTLVQVGSSRLEFRASPGSVIFDLVFVVMGLGATIVCLLAILAPGRPAPSPGAYLGLLVGLFFVVSGAGMLYSGTTPIIFDRQKGCFWRGRKAPDEMPGQDTRKDCTELNSIHALQLVSEYCRGNKSSFHSYELNLILADGRRINVVDHGNQEGIRADAATLAAFLKVPLWDAL